MADDGANLSHGATLNEAAAATAPNLPEGDPAQVPRGGTPASITGRLPPGLVHTASSDTPTFESLLERPGSWEAFNLQRRLSRLRRRTLTRARVQAQEAGEGHSVQLATFTYRPGATWSRRHIAHCLKCYREQARRDGVHFRYEWVAELQTRRMGRLIGDEEWSLEKAAVQCMHYHALIWAPSGYVWPMPDNRGWWLHGMTQVEVARHPAGYLAKYASKGSGGFRMPKGCRISGGGGLSARGRSEVAWWLLPRYVREAFPVVGQRIRRERGGGWYNYDLGQFLRAVDYW